MVIMDHDVEGTLWSVLKLKKIVKEAFDWLQKIENPPHCRLSCKQYYRWKAEKIKENKWTEEKATKNSFRAWKTPVGAAVNSAVFIPERLIVTPQKWA